MGVKFIRVAVVYLLIGACVGLAMGMSQQFTLAPVHAHLLLLGWASMALAGLIYHWYPTAGTTRLARIHFWLHNLALPVFMVALGLYLTGTTAAFRSSPAPPRSFSSGLRSSRPTSSST